MPASDIAHFSSAVSRASPRSASLTSPSLVRITFSGLMSRWIKPRWCACFSASATAMTISQRLLLLEDLVLVELVLDRGPLDVLHHEVVIAVDLAGVDGVDDVVVRELGGDLGLAVEPLDELLVLRQGVEQDLDGDDAIDGDLAAPCRRSPSTPCRASRGSGSRGSRACLAVSPRALRSRIDWFLVRTLASTMISSRPLDSSLDASLAL